MGVEHYAVCRTCEEYIDLHKAYAFSMVVDAQFPPVGVDCERSGYNDVILVGGYWESRGLWFVWKHRGHQGIELWRDTSDDWWNLEPRLKEVFPYAEDEKLRERARKTKEMP
jgi:hypothetical protein